MTDCDVAIVGAGPAGLSAAREAAALGCSVVLLDDNPRPGGQYLRQPPGAWQEEPGGVFARERHRAHGLFGVVEHPAVDYRPGATVWDLPAPGVLAVAAGDRSGRVAARAIVLATGARDKPAPFPGWTLPGVITAGGAQNLMKSQRVLPGRRIVVAGNGPLLLVTAASLVGLGAEVVAVVEAAPVAGRVLGALPGVLRAPGLFALGLRLRTRLARAGVPYLAGWTVVRAEGRAGDGDGNGDEVEAVEIAALARGGGIDRGRQRRLAADTLIAGFGLVPSDELARLAGCRRVLDPRSGDTMVQRDGDLMTSRPDLFAAGDGTAIGGVELALVEGALAGLAAAARLGRGDGAAQRTGLLRRRRAHLGAFADGLARVFAPPLGVADLVTGDTVVCRCENLTLEDIEGRRREGATSMLQLKAATRMGMGRCQGRNCLATLAALVAGSTGAETPAPTWPRGRPPARPIRLADLQHEEIPPAALPDDPHLPRERK